MQVQACGRLFIISGPSGVGKTTLVNNVIAGLQSKYKVQRSITYTSRQPRKGEQQARDYFFISEREFEQKIEQGFFLEWSRAYGAYYGSAKIVLDYIAQGNSYIAILDYTGACAVASAYPQAMNIWISPPDIATLQRRLEQRYTESQEQLERRLMLAQNELEIVKNEARLFTHALVNDNFLVTCAQLSAIITQSLD